MKTRKNKQKSRKGKKPTRQVICTDAMLWLANNQNLDSVVTSIPEMDELLTPQEAADALKLSVHTLSAWRSRPGADGPDWINVGGAIRYKRSDLDKWISTRQRNGNPTSA